MTITALDREALPEPGFLIGGKMTKTTSDVVFPHHYPATGELTYEVPLAGPAEVDAAVKAARQAFPAWRAMPGNERRQLMFKYAAAIRQRAEELRRLIIAENGVTYVGAMFSVPWVAELFEYNAGFADKIGGLLVPTFPGPALDYTLDEPYGVVAVIVPWNGPFVSYGQTLAPALAAGNTIVIKPPELAPYTCLRLAQIAEEAGFPPGVINVIPGGPVGGDALVSHPGIDKIFFTGSGATARKIQAAAAPNLTPAGYELGGKSARLVFADADLDSAALNSAMGAVANSGQACIAGTRVIVEESVYDEVIERMKAVIGHITVGDPQDPNIAMGPVISQGAVDRITGFIDRAVGANKGQLVTGGTRLGGELAGGYFMPPTIFANFGNHDEVSEQEIFGPVVSVLKFKTEEEAVAMANDSVYGLAAWVETKDVTRAHSVAAQLDAGTVWINGFYDLPVGAPFGGVKQSGFGRQGGIYAIQEFTRPKNVWLSLAKERLSPF